MRRQSRITITEKQKEVDKQIGSIQALKLKV